MSQPVSFQDAIAQSAEWIRLWDAEELSDDVLADQVGALVRERDGARGFFVASLTSDSPLMDRLPEALVSQLRLAGTGVVDLTARNLAMSSAMIIHHRRNQDDGHMEGSMRVQARCVELIRQLDPKLVKEMLEAMLLGLRSEGAEQDFFDRWGYDKEQRTEIELSILAVAGRDQN